YWESRSATVVIDHVDAYKDGGTLANSWRLNAVDIPLTFPVLSMTADPANTNDVLMLEGPGGADTAAAWEVDPFLPGKISYVDYPGVEQLVSVASFPQNGYNR